MLPRSTALLLLDCQTAWELPYWGPRNNPGAEDLQARLLEAFRASGRPVIHLRLDERDPHSPHHPQEPGNAIRPDVAPLPEEPVLGRSSLSPFQGTDLETRLRAQGCDRIVLAGFSSGGGVSTTARVAADLGLRVLLAHDACVAFDLEDPFGGLVDAETLHRVALTELQGVYALVMETEDLLQVI